MNKLTHIDGTNVEHAIGFFTDGCHKIYVAETEDDVNQMHGYGYDELHPMTALEKTFEAACYLRFISWVDLGKPEIVPQCAKRVVFEYDTDMGGVNSIVRFDA